MVKCLIIHRRSYELLPSIYSMYHQRKLIHISPIYKHSNVIFYIILILFPDYPIKDVIIINKLTRKKKNIYIYIYLHLMNTNKK